MLGFTRTLCVSLAHGRFFHKIHPDGHSAAASRDLPAFNVYQFMLFALVKTDPNAGDEVGGIAREPGVRIVVRRARFSGRWREKSLVAHAAPRALINYEF